MSSRRSGFRKRQYLALCSIIAFETISAATAQPVSFHVDRGAVSVELSCSEGRILLSGPVPAAGNERHAAGNAIAVIAEAPKVEPQILVGTLHQRNGTAVFNVVVDRSNAVIGALATDSPVSFTRQMASYTLPNPAGSQRLKLLISSCNTDRSTALTTASVPTSSSFIELAADLKVAGTRWWVVMASRPTPEEAFEVAAELSPKMSGVQVVRAANGNYAVVSGPEQVVDTSKFRLALVESGKVPKDTFLSRGDRFTARVRRR